MQQRTKVHFSQAVSL